MACSDEFATDGEIGVAGGLRLAFSRIGSGDLPLVLLHGYTFSMESWDRVSGLLRGCTVFRYDLRGFGRSVHAGDYRLERHVEDLRDVMKALGLRRAALAGHSLGGQIATAFALEDPDRVSALVLCGVRPPSMPPPEAAANDVEARRRAYDTAEGAIAVLRRHIPGYFDPRNLEPEDAERFVARGMRADRRALAQLLDVMYAYRVVPAEEMRRLSMPVLLLYGANDDRTPPAFAAPLKAIWPQAEVSVIAGSGHTPMWERPQAWSEAVNGFLARSGLTKPDS